MFGSLYIPCLEVITVETMCPDDCWGPLHYARIIFASVFGIIYIGIAMLYSMTYYSHNPTSGFCVESMPCKLSELNIFEYSASLLARPHSRIQTWQLLFSETFVLFHRPSGGSVGVAGA